MILFLTLVCGTGSFLIAGMNKIYTIIDNSNLSNKQDLKNKLKETQLLGFEKNTTMYSLAISNMLFRGDGKSKIYNEDFFSDEADKILNDTEISVGFINPPYGGGDNTKNPTKKEIQFLEKMLDNVSRYGIMIAPLSSYLQNDDTRNSILTKHTLKYVISMPNDLFQPNAMTHTAISVFETHSPHSNKEVIFFDLKDDGFVLSKNKGRTDRFNKWHDIKKTMFKKINNINTLQDNLILLKTPIKENDKWFIHAHSGTDYSKLTKNLFIQNIKDFLVYNVKKELNIIDDNIDAISMSEILRNHYDFSSKNEKVIELPNINNWKQFDLINFFDMYASPYCPDTSYKDGSTPLISASDKNNGVMSFTDLPSKFEGNCLTIGKVGMTIFYQQENFCATSDCTTLIPKSNIENFNIYKALFIKTILSQENYKWSYGRQIRLNNCKELKIKLPINSVSNPDWQFMENYVKSLPYSNNLQKASSDNE